MTKFSKSKRCYRRVHHSSRENDERSRESPSVCGQSGACLRFTSLRFASTRELSKARVCGSQHAWAMLWHATRPLLAPELAPWADAEEGLNSEGERERQIALHALVPTCTRAPLPSFAGHIHEDITPPHAHGAGVVQNNRHDDDYSCTKSEGRNGVAFR